MGSDHESSMAFRLEEISLLFSEYFPEYSSNWTLYEWTGLDDAWGTHDEIKKSYILIFH